MTSLLMEINIDRIWPQYKNTCLYKKSSKVQQEHLWCKGNIKVRIKWMWKCVLVKLQKKYSYIWMHCFYFEKQY